MGNRGPQPVPTQILESRGSWRAKIRVEEPAAVKIAPVMPKWVTGLAVDIWNELVGQLVEMGTLGSCDGHHFGRYCVFMARWQNAILHPTELEIEKVIKLSEHIDRLGRAMGLSASARSGLAKPKENSRENRGKTPFTKVGQHTA